MTPATFAATFVTLWAAHQLADHWVQTGHQANNKHRHGKPIEDRIGRRACAAHVATYTLTTAVFVAAAWWLLHLDITPAGFVLGQAVSAVTHYWADRRFTLARLCTALGKADFYQLGAPRPDHNDNPSLGTGAYSLDQSFHVVFLFIAALLTALI